MDDASPMTARANGSSAPQKSSQDASPDVQDEGKYVYAIIGSETPRTFGPLGIGGRNDIVHTVHHENLAAVVSNTPVVIYDPTRENVLAHERVNEIVMQEFTVIPMSFGTVFRTERDVVELLKHTADALKDVLAKMKDKIEFGLKANWEVEAVLREVEVEREDIRFLKQEITSKQLSSTYFARMQLGRLVEQALSQQSERFVSEIYDSLRDCCVASRHNKPIGDKMILNAAFLVEKTAVSIFERRVQEIAQKYDGRLKFLFTGPWPPYNFVNIRLKLERAGASF